MAQRLPRINCKTYLEGLCGHPAAPSSSFWGKPECVLMCGDPRIQVCALQDSFTKPQAPSMPPPTTEYLGRKDSYLKNN